MKPISLFIITAVLGAFGMLTLFMSSSVIFDLFNIRVHEGNYVLFIVWANFFSGLLFLAAAVAFFQRKAWSHIPLVISLGILVAAFAGLMLHINGGGVYETKTIGAMIFRMTVNAALALVLYSTTKKLQSSTLVKSGMIALLSLGAIATSCGHRHGDEHDHEAMESEASHHHEGDGGSLQLNDGEKWEADEHTISLVEEMKSELSAYDKAGKEEYHVLADTLTRQLNTLIVGCTMTGPAHEELHKWLVPVTENIKGLGGAQVASDARGEIIELEKSLSAFDDFFEPKRNN